MKPIISQLNQAISPRVLKTIIIKAILTALAVIGIFGFTPKSPSTGKGKLPQVILSSFSAKYSNARIKKWDVRGDEYIVNFKNTKRKCVAFYSPDGAWIKTEISVPWTKDLPIPVRKSLEDNGYGSYYIDGIKEILSPGQLIYVLQVDDGPSLDAKHYDAFKQTYKLTFSQNGVLKDKQMQK